MLVKLLNEIRTWLEEIFIKNSPGKTGIILRKIYWIGKFKRSGDFTLGAGCIISKPENISIGTGTRFMQNCNLNAYNGVISIGERVSVSTGAIINAGCMGKIEIGNDCLIGPNVVIRASNHKYAERHTPINKQGHTGGHIIIEDDVWLGANCVILPDVIIEKGAIVAAGAVVTDPVKPYTLVGGVPAKVIKENIRT